MKIFKKNRLQFLKVQLSFASVLFISLLLGGFFVFGPSLTQVVEALNGNYNRIPPAGDQLNMTDWNYLDEDFVKKEGDAMTGPLILPGPVSDDNEAATKQYVDDNISNISMKEIDGTPFTNIVCGKTDPNNTAWIVTNAAEKRIKVTVLTGPAGFSGTPMYFAGLGGVNYSNRSEGGESVRQADSTHFEIAVRYTGSLPFDDNVARSWGWHVIWCGYGD